MPGKKLNTPQRKSRFRRSLLVYPGFQLGLVAINMLIMVAGFILVGIQTTRAYSALRNRGTESELPGEHAYYHFIQYQENHLYGYMIAGALAAIAVSLVVTLVYSHRLAGPIVRLKNYLTLITETGKRPPLEFREDDFFQELPFLVNEAFDRIEREARGEIEAAPRRALRAVDSDDPDRESA